MAQEEGPRGQEFVRRRTPAIPATSTRNKSICMPVPQYQQYGESSGTGGQGPPKGPPTDHMSAVGSAPGDHDSSSDSLDSEQEDALRKALEQATVKSVVKQARRAENAPVRPPSPKQPLSTPYPSHATPPAQARVIGVEDQFPNLPPRTGSHLKRNTITPKPYTAAANQDLRARSTSAVTYFEVKAWIGELAKQRITLPAPSTNEKQGNVLSNSRNG